MSTVDIRSILVATGLGPETDLPVQVAGLLSARAGADLHLLHALELRPVPAGKAEGDAEPNFRAFVDRTAADLAAQARRALPEGIEPSSSEVVVFIPHKAILNRALQVGADLIVLGAHRRRPYGDYILGPTPDRVIRSAAAPCLVVPRCEVRPFRRIVAPIDLQMPAAAALDLAQRWARTFGPEDDEGMQIDLLYIAPETAAAREAAAPGGEYERALQRQLEQSTARLSAGTRLSVHPVIRHGRPPAEAILRYLDEAQADLVVLGTRGFGAIRRALIGSVASTIARQAACPILLVPPVLWKGEVRG